MKKRSALPAIACLLLMVLSACGSADVSTPPETGTPTESVSPTPEEPETSAEPVELPRFLENFYVSSVSFDPELSMTYTFTGQESEQFRQLLDTASWTTATDIPAMGLPTDYTLFDLSGNSLAMAPWDNGHCLILAKSGEELNTGWLYFAPLSVCESCDAWIRSVAPTERAAAFADFQYDTARVGRTPASDGDYYLDYWVYLFDEDEAASLSQLIVSAEKTSVGNAAMLGDSLCFQFYNDTGESVTISSYLNEQCLINYFPKDGGAFRFFAPLSLIDEITHYMDSLTPLGIVDETTEYYFDLFRQEPGVEWLLGFATEDGSFCAEQLIPFAASRILGYQLEEPSVSLTEEEVIQRQFALPYPQEELPSRDMNSGAYLMLRQLDSGESGILTALFDCYFIPDSFWLNGLLPEAQLAHIKEYLLTGHDEDFPEPQQAEIVFEVRFDTESQTNYVFYHSVRILEGG